jgi:fructokinase
VEPEARPLDVLTIGEMVVDFISAEQTNTLGNASTFRRYLGGSPANIAVYVSKLGGASAVVATIGIGAFGTFLEGELQRHGVTTEYLAMYLRTHTTVIFIFSTSATPDSEKFRSGDYLLRPEEVPEEAISRTRMVHASTFTLSREPCRSAVLWAFRKAREMGNIVTLDPNYDPRDWPDKVEVWEVLAEVMPYVTIVRPSLEDARRLFDFNMDEETPEKTALAEFHDLGADVVLTRSGGVTISDHGSVGRVGPLPKVQTENVTGTSDAFWSALLMARLDGKNWSEAVRFAHEIASLKLGVEGHVERMIDLEAIYTRLRTTAGQPS